MPLCRTWSDSPYLLAGWPCCGLRCLIRGQECGYGLGDGARGAPGQVMTRAVDELEAGARQGLRQQAGRADRHDGVARVSQHQYGRLNRGDGALQLRQVTQERSLLGQEGAPQRAGSATRPGPDLPVDVLVRPWRAAAPPGGGGGSSLPQPLAQPGPTLASSTTASTRSGALLAAASATPPPYE